MDRGCFPKKFIRIALESGFSSIVGSQDYLRAMYQMDAATITKRIEKLLDE